MKRLSITVAVCAIVWAFASQGAMAQTSGPGTPSDDIGDDGLKHRGDGSIDDDQNGDDQDDDIGADGLKHRGDGSIDDDQDGDRQRRRGREDADVAREDRSGRGSDHERGRDRDVEREHGGRGHG